jgi:hypothetical protein
MHAAVQSITIKVSEVDSALLNDADELQKMLRNVTELADLHSLESVTHQFSPQGISAALLLSESHIAIHTWPESDGDKSFFGGKTNKQMKRKLNTGSKPWANKAHNVVLAGKTLANEMTAANIENYGISSYDSILHDNNDNNDAVRTTIRNQQGMNPEDFPAAEDTEKIQRRIENQSTPPRRTN